MIGKVAVEIQVWCLTVPGENVCIVGECEELGRWRPEHSLHMDTDASRYPCWSLHLTLPTPLTCEFKCIKRRDRTVWEGGPNRTLRDCVEGGAESGQGCRYACVFGEPGVQDAFLSGPGEAAATGLVMFLHGLGGSGQENQWLARYARRPHIHWCFPDAPYRSITWLNGEVKRAWGDVRSLECEDDSMCGTWEESRGAVESALHRELESCGLQIEHVVLAGVSMGGAMALLAGTHLQRRHHIMGVAAINSWLPSAACLHAATATESTVSIDTSIDGETGTELSKPSKGTGSELPKPLPCYFAYNTGDPVVNPTFSAASLDVLLKSKDPELTVTTVTFEEASHDWTAESVRTFLSWVDRVLPP